MVKIIKTKFNYWLSKRIPNNNQIKYKEDNQSAEYLGFVITVNNKLRFG